MASAGFLASLEGTSPSGSEEAVYSGLMEEDVDIGELKRAGEEHKPNSGVKVEAPKTLTALDAMGPTDAMVFMFKELNTTLQGLSSEIRQVKARQVDLESIGNSNQGSQALEQVVKPENVAYPPDELESKNPCWWYAAAKGQGGVSGIYDSWGEASRLVVNVSGAVVQKFRDYLAAQAFVSNFQKSVSSKKSSGSEKANLAKAEWWYAVSNGKHGISNVFESWEEASQFVLGVSGVQTQKFRKSAKAFEFLEQHLEKPSPLRNMCDLDSEPPIPKRTEESNQDYRPPMILMVEDPSAKKDDQLFNIDMGTESELQEAVLPKGFPEGIGKVLIDGVNDGMALPGGFQGGSGDESGGSDFSLMGEALSELANQGQSRIDGVGRTGLQWKHDKRTSLCQIKNTSDLIKCIKVLTKLCHKVVTNTIKATRNACKRAGWRDTACIEAWTRGGYLTRTVHNMVENYLGLHQYLLRLCTSGATWEYVQVELDHYVEELEIICSTQDSRFQAICGLYAYLQDGATVNWHSNSMQYKRNLEIFTQHGEGGTSIGSTWDKTLTLGEGSGQCPKFGTALHPGGKVNCPFKHMSDNQAKKAGGQALLSLGAADKELPAEDEKGKKK